MGSNPVTPTKNPLIPFGIGGFFIFLLCFRDGIRTHDLFSVRTNVRDQVTEPTAAGGGGRKAEEKKNKEQYEAHQASNATIFFLVEWVRILTPNILSIHKEFDL